MANPTLHGLQVGQLYFSKVWLSPDKMPDRVPLPMLVTSIRGGLVYVRAYYGKHDDGTDWLGSRSYFPMDQKNKWLGDCVPGLNAEVKG